MVNIEIVGASHGDYIRPEEKNLWWESDLFLTGLSATVVDHVFGEEQRQWNNRVSTFVADLTTNSGSTEELERFLSQPPPEHGALITKEDNRWVVKLPGSEQRA